MVRRNDPTIDEEALRQAIGRQSSHGSVLRTREDPTSRAVGVCVCLITSKPSCV